MNSLTLQSSSSSSSSSSAPSNSSTAPEATNQLLQLLPPPSKPPQLPAHTHSNLHYRRARNTKNLSLNLPSTFSDLGGQPYTLCLHTAPIRTSTILNLEPLQASFPLPTASPPRKQDISARSSKMVVPTALTTRSPTSRKFTSASHSNTDSSSSRSAASSRSKSTSTLYFNTPKSIYSTIPNQHHNTSNPPSRTRILSLKIPDSPKAASRPSLVTKGDLASNFSFPYKPIAESPTPTPSTTTNPSHSTAESADRIVLVNNMLPLYQEECMETAANAYPFGPMLICEPGIYLYSEPSREEALKFDVVINVAKEVKNPFETTSDSPKSPALYTNPYSDSLNLDFSSAPSSPPSSVESSAGSDTVMSSPLLSSSSSDTTNTMLSSSAWQSLSSSPTSAPSSKPQTTPEYIFVPWGHTSTLTSDLTALTDLMQARTQQGKRILVHCQCGVSRSASLIVAYIMRQNQWGLHRAYRWVKAKSPNISPNMTLIYQLLEWGSMLNIPASHDPEDDEAFCG